MACAPAFECPCGDAPVIKVKATRRCGTGIVCGVQSQEEGADPDIYYNVVTDTYDCTLLDCTRVETITYNLGGGAFAVADCASVSPSCNGPDSTNNGGCEDEEHPWPGSCTGDLTRVYSDGSNINDLPALIVAAAVPDEDVDFTEFARDNIVGSIAGYNAGTARKPSWKFRRYKRRWPVHLRLEITESDVDLSAATVEEAFIYLPADDDDEVEFIMDLPPLGRISTVTALEIAYGRLPAGWDA